MFTDIFTNEASIFAGSLGLLPSASLGNPGRSGLIEPIHGSTPAIAGSGIANPVGTILSAAMILQASLGLPDEAKRIETAVMSAVHDGVWTVDLSGTLSTEEMGQAVGERLSAQ